MKGWKDFFQVLLRGKRVVRALWILALVRCVASLYQVLLLLSFSS
jgi:hypothetical protein